MSGKDETDLVRNKELPTAEPTTVESLKSNLESAHDQSNGDASPSMNGDKSNNSDDSNKQTPVESPIKPSTPSTPSNWVQFDTEDDSDKVCKYPIRFQQNVFVITSASENSERKQLTLGSRLSHRNI